MRLPSANGSMFAAKSDKNEVHETTDNLSNTSSETLKDDIINLDPSSNIPDACDAIAVCYYERPDSARQEEFVLLAQSLGNTDVAVLGGKLYRKSAATYLTSGRAALLKQWAEATEAKRILVDAELSGIQLRNLQQLTGLPVLDRTGLIINIFASRARSQAGKLQVELARLNYLSTHLVREWSHLERQRGGLSKIGGPGEKQLELDRRLNAKKIRRLRQQLTLLTKQRQAQRKVRQRRGALMVALVGYTNAGKSTLFNVLTKAHALTKDQLFASLDPMARRLYLPDLPVDQQNVIGLDTVGFIRDLPHGLVEAFHATLEETRQADLLLIVADISAPHALDRLHDVRSVLTSIGSHNIPQLLVWNKIDCLSKHNEPLLDSFNTPDGCTIPVRISARTHEGIPQLQNAIARALQKNL